LRRSAPALAACAALGCGAASFDVTVRDGAGAPLEDAVVYAVAKSGAVPPAATRTAEVAQKDRQFVPPVSVVQAGTSVRFPNRDPFRHHVYSFSPAKVFEIKLYVGTPADPVVFEKPGEVALGCNIHDSMVGYIYVVDTPYFAKTGKDGRARVDVPAGDYDLKVWHFAQVSAGRPRPMSARGSEAAAASFDVPLRTLPPRPSS
jgi:plastocyanin